MTQTVETTAAVRTIIPAVNITETPTSFIVSLDIPGAAKDGITAAVENNTLVVTAKVPSVIESDKVRSTTEYRREFTLANDIDLQSVDAHYLAGVLTITLTKKQQNIAKQININ